MMHSKHFVAILVLGFGLSACSGSGEGGNSVPGGAAEEARGADAVRHDADSPAGRAYRDVLECAATMAASRVRVSSVETDGDARRAQEASRQRKADALRARAVELGAAAGLSPDAVVEEFDTHRSSFVHGRGMGTRAEYGALVMRQADECAARYPDIVS